MPLTSLPLVAWGSADDLSTYTPIGTAGLTPGQTDPFGGPGGYTIADGSAVVSEARFKLLPTLPNGTNWFTAFVRGGSAVASGFEIWDNTAGITRHQFKFPWSAGVAGAGVTTSGNGTILGPISTGPLWYMYLFSALGMVGDHANRMYLYPTDPTVASQIGNAIFCVRSAVLLDLFDEAVSWEEDREGSEYQQGPSGFEDAARVGIDHYLEGRARYMPQAPRLDPGPVSGWYGENEGVGVNCGVKAMLRAGREKQLLRWAPDRSLASVSQDAYLVEPMREKPGLERNWERTFTMRLRSASVFAGV